MDEPAVQYFRTHDGYSLAYWDIGKGRPVLLVPSRFNSLRQVWNRFGPWFRPLLDGNRFISFDSRGQGLSTRGLPADISVRHYVEDLAAIIDHIGISRLTLIGQGFGGHVAVRYAAEHPERVAAMVLATVTVDQRGWNLPFWADMPRENWELFLQSLAPRDLTGEALKNWLANVRENETQADYLLAMTASSSSNIEDALPMLEAPTLVMHPRNFVMVPEEEATKLASAIPNARLVMLSGDAVFLGNPQEFVATTKAFLADLPLVYGEDKTRAVQLPARLSPREMEVLRLIAAGKSNQQIADTLVLSLRTVERHITNLYGKIGAHGKADATAYALRHGFD